MDQRYLVEDIKKEENKIISDQKPQEKSLHFEEFCESFHVTFFFRCFLIRG